MRIIFVADFFANQILGGGELNNQVFVHRIRERGFDVEEINSHLVTISFLKNHQDACFVIANFVNLKPVSLAYLQKHCRYVIYEHDHKYVEGRNPAHYPDFLIPREEIINYDFYKDAINVFCQSSFHKDIVEKNLLLSNIINLSGNLWSDDDLAVIEALESKDKEDRAIILHSQIPHKNTAGAIEFCKRKNIDFMLAESASYYQFLELIAANSRLVFLPKSPETLSRIVVEARMLGLSVITNNNVGAKYEDWINLKGVDLIEYVRGMRTRIVDTVLESFN